MHFEIAQRSDDSRWFWYLVGANGTEILRSASYPTRAAAFRDIQQIVGNRNVPIYERAPDEETPRQLEAAIHSAPVALLDA
jgi:uncharacterized protein YegP (UPF0339 family)